MNFSQASLRRASRLRWSSQSKALALSRQGVRFASNGPEERARRQGGNALVQAAVYAGTFGAFAAGVYYYPELKAAAFGSPQDAEALQSEAKLGKPRKQAVAIGDNRDMITSQDHQVRNSWEHPGVYAWGSNVGKVIDPNSKDKYVKQPRRIAYFNDQLLRDLKLTPAFGAAITEKGDLVQWGLGFSAASPLPSTTLKGKDLVKIEVSTDRIIAMSSGGDVYSVPTSRDDLEGGLKDDQQKSSWSLWSSGGKESLNFRKLTPSGLGWGERVTDISSGLEHCLILTSKGRVFSAASSASAYPSKGQMGIAGLTWQTRPQGPYDQAQEITALKDFKITGVATGDHHSVALDQAGRVFSFGDNTYGQLGFDAEAGFPQTNSPVIVPVNSLYGSGMVPKVTSIAAGGTNTFFTVDSITPTPESQLRATVPAKRMPQSVFDLWACGQGVMGTLGTGKWTHVSSTPTKVKALSSLFEFDEKTNQNRPIKLKALSIGSTHCAAVMANATKTTARPGDKDTNWGSDVLFWGGNEHYQLGTGKRTNMNAPSYIAPLDGGDLARLCLTPRQTVRIGQGGKGRKATLEQKVECGKFVTAVYSAV